MPESIPRSSLAVAIAELIGEATGFGPVEAANLSHRIMLLVDPEPAEREPVDCEHHSWAGLMALLDEHWPADVFPTRHVDDVQRDAGARIVSLVRWVDQLKNEPLRPGEEVTFESGGAQYLITIGERVETFRALARGEQDGFLRVHQVTPVPAVPREPGDRYTARLTTDPEVLHQVAAGLRSETSAQVCGVVNPADDQLFCHLPPRHKKEHRVGHRSWDNEADPRERCAAPHPADPWMDCQLRPGHMGDPSVPGRMHRCNNVVWG